MKDNEVDGKAYSMIFPEDYEDASLRGKAKGMKLVLQERGLWKEGLRKKCADCKQEPVRPDCCAQRILELQPDFQAQRSRLEEIADRAG